LNDISATQKSGKSVKMAKMAKAIQYATLPTVNELFRVISESSLRQPD
jgi:hypothetical protein